MVLEKLVRLEVDDKKEKLVIKETKEEVINPEQLSDIVLLKLSRAPFPFYAAEDLKTFEKNAPAKANAFLSEHIYIGRTSYSQIVYYKIDEAQALRAPKKEIKDTTN